MNKRFLWQTAALSIMTAVFFSASSVCLGQWNNSNSSGKTLMDVMRGKSTSSQPQPMPASYPPPAQMTSAPMTPSVQTAAPSSFHSHNHNAQSYQTGNAKQSFIRPVPISGSAPSAPSEWNPGPSASASQTLPPEYSMPGAPVGSVPMEEPKKWSLKGWFSGAFNGKSENSYPAPAASMPTPVASMPTPAYNPQYPSPVPAQSVPISSSPIQSVPVQSSPVQTMPVQTMPVQSVPVHSEPMQGVTMQSVPPMQSVPLDGTTIPSLPPQNSEISEGATITDFDPSKYRYDPELGGYVIADETVNEQMANALAAHTGNGFSPTPAAMPTPAVQPTPAAPASDSSAPVNPFAQPTQAAPSSDSSAPVNPFAQPTVVSPQPTVGAGATHSQSILTTNSPENSSPADNSGKSDNSTNLSPASAPTMVAPTETSAAPQPDNKSYMPAPEFNRFPTEQGNALANASTPEVKATPQEPGALAMEPAMPMVSNQNDVKTEKPEEIKNESASGNDKGQETVIPPLAAPSSAELLPRNASTPAVALKIDISGPDEVEFGKNETFTLKVENPGSVERHDVILYVSPEGFGEDKTASLPLKSLKPGESRSVMMKLNARQRNKLSLTAVVEDGQGTQVEKVFNVRVKNESVKISVLPPQKAAPFVGDSTSYVVRLINTSEEANQLHVTVFFGDDIEPVRAAGAPNTIQSGQVVIDKPIELNRGEMRDLEITAIALTPGSHKMMVHVVDSFGATYSTKVCCAYRQRERENESSSEQSPKIELSAQSTPNNNDAWTPAKNPVENNVNKNEAPSDKKEAPSTASESNLAQPQLLPQTLPGNVNYEASPILDDEPTVSSNGKVGYVTVRRRGSSKPAANKFKQEPNPNSGDLIMPLFTE